jgi:hypothetical protein
LELVAVLALAGRVEAGDEGLGAVQLLQGGLEIILQETGGDTLEDVVQLPAAILAMGVGGEAIDPVKVGGQIFVVIIRL